MDGEPVELLEEIMWTPNWTERSQWQQMQEGSVLFKV